MRFILFILLGTGCSGTASKVAPPAAPTTAATTSAATCGGDEPAPIEIKIEVEKSAKNLFDRAACAD